MLFRSEPGDVLLYYTDGVTEATGLGGERFDEERLVAGFQADSRSGLAAQGILDQLFARLDRFVGADRPLEDDASMVVLKVREEVMLPPLPLAERAVPRVSKGGPEPRPQRRG